MDPWYSYPNRTVCNVLEEMRQAVSNRPIRPRHLKGLIEEAQTLVNRMEAGLEDWRDVREFTEKRRELRKELKELEAKKKKLESSNE